MSEPITEGTLKQLTEVMARQACEAMLEEKQRARAASADPLAVARIWSGGCPAPEGRYWLCWDFGGGMIRSGRTMPRDEAEAWARTTNRKHGAGTEWAEAVVPAR